MASLDMKMTLESGEDLSFTIPGCLSSKEVEELLKGLQSSLGPHLPPSASDQIKRLTAPTGPCMPPPTTAQASSPDSSASGKAAKKRLAATRQVCHLKCAFLIAYLHTR